MVIVGTVPPGASGWRGRLAEGKGTVRCPCLKLELQVKEVSEVYALVWQKMEHLLTFFVPESSVSTWLPPGAIRLPKAPTWLSWSLGILCPILWYTWLSCRLESLCHTQAPEAGAEWGGRRKHELLCQFSLAVSPFIRHYVY